MRLPLLAIAALTLSAFVAQQAPPPPVGPVPIPYPITAQSQGAKSKAELGVMKRVEKQEQSRVLAVITYADWCSSCKILDPKVAIVRARGDIEGVTYLVLDFSKKDAEATLAVADKAGVGPAVRGHFGNTILTGEVLLVDRAQNKIISVVKKTMTPDEIEAAIKAAAASV